MTLTSYPLAVALKPLDAIGQLVSRQSGVETPIGGRTCNPMALVSAVPLADSDKIVLTFLDRSDPVETFDRQVNSGDNAVLIVRADIGSIVKGVNEGTGVA